MDQLEDATFVQIHRCAANGRSSFDLPHRVGRKPDSRHYRHGLHDGGSGYGIVLNAELDWSPLFLLGILNSRLTTYFLKKTSSAFRGGYIALNRQYIKDIALPEVKGKSPAHDRIVALVEKMLDLHRQRALVKTPHEQTALDRQITATDCQIDRLVYDLYGLTEEEIKLVEGA